MQLNENGSLVCLQSKTEHPDDTHHWKESTASEYGPEVEVAVGAIAPKPKDGAAAAAAAGAAAVVGAPKING